MRRKFGHVVNILFLALCAAAAILWVRTLWLSDFLDVRIITGDEKIHQWKIYVTSQHDRVKVEFDHHVSADPRSVQYLKREQAFASNWSTGDRSLEYNVWRDAKVAAWRGFLDDHGFCWWSHEYGHVVGVPHWFIVFSLAICPTVFALRWHNHRRRRSRGACVNCGYDLRATPGRCPECGTEPAAPALTRLTSATSVESSPPKPDPAARPTQPPPPARAA